MFMVFFHALIGDQAETTNSLQLKIKPIHRGRGGSLVSNPGVQ